MAAGPTPFAPAAEDALEAIYGDALLRAMAERADQPAWLSLWRAIAFLGSPTFYSALIPVAFAALSRRSSLRLTLLFASSAALAEAAKHAIGRARPDPAVFGLEQSLEHAGAFENAALPSGHALMAVVIWGWLVLRTGSTAVRALAGSGILLISFSRLVLVRHDLLDVGTGWLAGAVLLLLLHRADRSWGASLARLPGVEQAGLWILSCVSLQLMIGLPVTAIVLGVAAGLGSGAIAAARLRARQSRPGPLSIAIRATLGIAGVAAARAIADPDHGWGTLALFGVYFVAALWVACVIPTLLGGTWVTRWE